LRKKNEAPVETTMAICACMTIHLTRFPDKKFKKREDRTSLTESISFACSSTEEPTMKKSACSPSKTFRCHALSIAIAGFFLAAGSTAALAQTKPRIVGRPLPPVLLDRPPGASFQAQYTAKAIARGVNFGNIFEAPREGDWGLFFSDTLVDQAWNAGFKSVRLPVRWSNHASATAPYAIDSAFMTRVEAAVDKLIAKGFYVVLDMHHYRQLEGDPLDTNEASVAASVLEDRFVAMWSQIAERFRGHNDRLVFELYNEPHGRLNGEPWNILAARGLAAVRVSNPSRVVVLGPTHWNNASDLALLKIPFDANLVFTIHQYEPFNFTHQGAEWIQPALPTGVTCCNATQLAQIAAPLDIAKAWSKTNRYPMFVGEFGAYNKAPSASRAIFNRSMRDAAEARGFTWQYWEFASGFGVYDPGSGSFRTELLNSLLGDAAASRIEQARPPKRPASASESGQKIR
jgi:endoglucanase